jgi:hypothetical protein
MEHPEEKEPPEVITSDTENATTIQVSDVPVGKKRKFKKFRAYNTGTWNGPKRENKEVTRRQDDLHRYDSISSTLSLTDYQKKRGRRIFDNFDAHQFGQKLDHIIFGICVVVANDDVENGTRYWPADWGGDDSSFEELGKSINIDWKKQISIVNKVRDRVDL